MKRPELLAPAGNMESLYAAIEAGCDAVYLGGYTFGARVFAHNFSIEEMEMAVKLCHLYGVKVYVTVNTLIYESEMEMLLEYVDELVRIHVDALLIQDLGALHLIHQVYPDLELHASTQMHIHNLDGVKMAEQLGIRRVVLARETEIEMVKKIKEHSSLEVEIFVHGALCVSYSGQCLMSSLIGGRSGNRGSCAGSCRQKYSLISCKDGKETIEKEDGYLLSMKDLNTLEHISSLLDLGVDSLKIEGRMKSPSYVYLVVSLYREAIDSYMKTGKVEFDKNRLEKLKYVFHRSFTKGLLFHDDKEKLINPERPNHLGVEIGKVVDVHRDNVSILLTKPVRQKDGIRILGKEDTGCFLNVFYKNRKRVKEAYPGDVITFSMKGTVMKRAKVVKTYDEEMTQEIDTLIQSHKRLVPVDMSVTLEVGKPLKLRLDCEGKSVVVESEVLLASPQKEGTKKERIIEQLCKLGGTVYELNDIEVVEKESVFVPISVVNEVRRNAVEKLNQLRLERPVLKKCRYLVEPLGVKQTKKVEVLVTSKEQYQHVKNMSVDMICNFQDQNEMEAVSMIRYPNVIDHYEPCLKKMMVEELGGLCHQPYATGVGLNVCNSYTVYFLHQLGVKEVTLSLECNEIQVQELINAYQSRYHELPNVTRIIRTIPKMMTIRAKLLPERKKDTWYYLKDRFSNRYPVYENEHVTELYYDRVLTFQTRRENQLLGIGNVRYEYLKEEPISAMSKIGK